MASFDGVKSFQDIKLPRIGLLIFIDDDILTSFVNTNVQVHIQHEKIIKLINLDITF